MDRQEFLYLVDVPILTGAWITISATILVSGKYASSEGIHYIEFVSFFFILGLVVSYLLYRYLPKTTKEVKAENQARLTLDNQRLLNNLLRDSLIEEKKKLEAGQIPFVEDLAEKELKNDLEQTPDIITDLIPLWHFEGYMLPPKIEKLPDLLDGQHRASFTNVGASHSDRGRLEPSQVFEVYWNDPKGEDIGDFRELVVKFGVVRVKAIKGELKNVRAQVKIQINKDGFHDSLSAGKPRDQGYLNWFSLAKKRELLGNNVALEEINAKKGYGLNNYLKNSVEYIHENESKDLLFFYMIKGVNQVFLCTETIFSTASNVILDGKTVEFDAVISLTADSYRKTDFRFHVIISGFDRFNIQKMS